ncbi:MAG: DUF3800 domain-containing protein [Clostridia bacterium]|jgi:hypothetical protein|nr:DUF3800 domain-containing protein [Clostridia bacterium]
MQENIYSSNYFFVDESGDTTFYNRNGEWVVGKENGASPLLLMGFIRTTEPEFLRRKIVGLKSEIINDAYLKDIPSIKKTKIAFHAKDDCPEVRYKVFKLLNDLPFKCNIVIARKTKNVFEKYNGNTQELYDSLITHLFKNILQLSNNNYIYVATRGNRKRQEPLEEAIHNALLYTEEKLNHTLASIQKVLPQTPSGEECLQIIDYCNWAIQRAIIKGEMRYYNFLKEKFGLIVDLYDYKQGWKNFYTSKNPFDINKISPLRLGI